MNRFLSQNTHRKLKQALDIPGQAHLCTNKYVQFVKIPASVRGILGKKAAKCCTYAVIAKFGVMFWLFNHLILILGHAP
jgi:hypothetical protein